MAYYHSLRSWLEIEPENFLSVIGIIKSFQKRYENHPKFSLYLQGWCWSETHINWTHYLFYGADVTEEGLEFFKDMLSDLAKSGLNLSGYFHAQGEDGEKNYLYKMLDDQVYLQEPLSNLEVT
ncbi:hypothetical protein THII_2487 [Thioploca ingrica]|uniref:Uncharacterized protein n=1 Tax=Thioploca ingrica TaxID=40754 RepID=A0A090AHK8_9GAMM|nr:hypothetical protein THII_2487 [Thioploca ingrica]